MRLRTVTAGPALAVFVAATVALSALPATASTGMRSAGSPVSASSAALLAAPTVSVANVNTHLQQLQTIATSNGGNRATGTAGHTATTTYLQQKLQAAGYTVTVQTCTTCSGGSAKNIIADWPGGNTSNTYMFGAHSDSVSAGPGINDDGSGTATLLEAALVLAANNPTMTNHVRFGWWAGEEQGLIGSKFYVNSLTTAQKTAIKAYGTFDMIASTNGGYFVTGTDAVAVKLRDYFTSISVPTETSTECCSDDGSFRNAGIPSSINSTGASYTKTSAQVTKWGGTAGSAYDPCYHKACDSYPSNINSTSLGRWANAELYAAWTLTTATSTANDFSVALSPSTATVTPGSSATTTVSTATTSGSAQTVALTSSGAPTGVTVSFSPASVTSGGSATMTVATTTAAASGSYTITVTGTGSATHTAAYTLTVGTTGGCTGAGQKLGNPGFETATTPWTASTGVIGANTGDGAPRTGTRDAWLNGNGSTNTETLSQSVTIPSGCTAYTLSFYLKISTSETTSSTQYDKLTVQVGTTTLQTFSNLNASAYTLRSYSLAAFAGQTVTLKFTGVEDSSLKTSFVIDDTALTVS
ncbi:M28 family peptidase [Actinoplanes awajinensis]|uniref:Aminopeptidase n=1 Tax=Actinoplanes awajinensis subsp. mycoplanecinus TaxID=135947 RepID=A0A101JBW0_9ACTN|nr:M28 family peptidase [Actinoplanes awajinensis]KUL23933.1 aminopeptidase [Actinoplanes awajinensis subsp. mycoplanecinus]